MTATYAILVVLHESSHVRPRILSFLIRYTLRGMSMTNNACRSYSAICPYSSSSPEVLQQFVFEQVSVWPQSEAKGTKASLVSSERFSDGMPSP